MCGVIGLVFARHHQGLGRVAADLLRTLEYRGYDSTGAAIQGDGETIRLVKGVGAPSLLVETLGITQMSGRVLCGQVRWATFGAVTVENAQPHEVRCKTHLYGAHNGNVTNCDDLKAWLESEGHRVLSDNDGEMVVHTVEHYFARELARLSVDDLAPERLVPARRRAMRAALLAAGERLQGSYAAVVVDPITRTVWAVKQGSSLYFGMGSGPEAGSFGIASSDLSSVLKLTRVVIPVHEGEFVEFDADHYDVYRLVPRPAGAHEPFAAAGQLLTRTPVRSRLRAKDTALLPRFETFMDQEISAQEQTCRDVVTLFRGGSDAARVLWPHLATLPNESLEAIRQALTKLRDLYDDEAIRREFYALCDSRELAALLARVPATVKGDGTDAPPEQLADRLRSSEAGFLADLLLMARGQDDLVLVRMLDVLLEKEEALGFAAAVDGFVAIADAAVHRGGRMFILCCGSSYHAAKAAALFFNAIARVEVIPILPGEYRGQYGHSVRDGDVFIAVSQSGETKDLIDVMNAVAESRRDVKCVAIVNNVNSTLAQEKADLVIPLRCGPEIAVPATKSFMNQLVVLYCLALRLAEHRLPAAQDATADTSEQARELAERFDALPSLPALIRETFDSTKADVELAAQQLYLCPSIHILATRLTAVAKEGALKVREVVLNHTEGIEGSEFKHGPNTILGFNTIFGPGQVDALLKHVGQTLDALVTRASARGIGEGGIRRLIQAVTDSVFSLSSTPFALRLEERELLATNASRSELVEQLYSDYPLIYVTGPDPTDINLTVSQINTHKIRGASTVVIAEDHPALRQAATKAPADNPRYRSVFVTLPRTNDTLMVVFSATVVLQRLALKMSQLKKQYLDRLGIRDHGVHPDVPKNVSKSITVD